MDMDKVFVIGSIGFLLYLMIFQTEKFNRANQAGYDNIEKTGKLLGTGAKAGWAIFKMFKK